LCCRYIRRKSPSEIRTETTPNIYGTRAGNSQHSGNGTPLDEKPNNPVGTGSVEESPYMNASNVSAPPIYAVIHKNRPGNAVVQSEASAPAGDTAAGDDAAPPSALLAQDTTLIDNDLYD